MNIFDLQLETERLILRPPVLEDFDAWTAFAGDAEGMRYLGGVQARSMAWRGMMSMIGAWAAEGFAMFSLIEKSSGRWIGRVGPWRPADWPGNEVGWGIVRDAWGKGYATEAATAAIDWSFDRLGWNDVIHCIDPDNAASQKLAQRLGSVNHGPGRMPPPHADAPTDIWGQARAQWHARRSTQA